MLLYIYISPRVKCVCWSINHINHIDYIYTINPHVKPVNCSLPSYLRTWGTLIKALGVGICGDAGAQSTSPLIVSATLGAGPGPIGYDLGIRFGKT